jgi:hypothetical protein
MPDTSPPQLIDIRQTTDKPFVCPTHGQVYAVLQFNDDYSRCYCTTCLEQFIIGQAEVVQLAVMQGG